MAALHRRLMHHEPHLVFFLHANGSGLHAHRAGIQLEVVLVEVGNCKARQAKDALHKVHCTEGRLSVHA